MSGGTTHGKRGREDAKRQRAKQKEERRAARVADRADRSEQPGSPAGDDSEILAALARLHEAFADGACDLEEFEAQRDELTSRLTV